MLDESLRGTQTIITETEDFNCHVFHLLEVAKSHYLKMESNLELIYHLRLKPNFWLYYLKGGYQEGTELIRPLFPNLKKVRVIQIYIDPSIFDILINEHLISYSKSVADLYYLPVEKSYDYFYHFRDYKRKHNKEKVLELQRQGIFN